jgi:cobalamin biosynthetic protein CobC
MENFARHGGRLRAAMAAWPDAPLPWIDLSTGINPRPYPAPRASRAARSRLPFPEEVAALEAAAARRFGLADPAGVAAVAGAETALRLLPRMLSGETVMIAGPTYASHAEAWSLAGARIVASEDDARVVVVVNPNNPDGRLRSSADLLALADRLATREGWLIVDESFADTVADASLAGQGHPRVIALRSFGKVFGLAGLRLGFILGPPEITRRAVDHLGDWPVSADALAAGLAAYADDDWAARMRASLARQASRLDQVLSGAGLTILGGTPLFRLAACDDAAGRFNRLCAQGVLTRPFADQPHWLRFGLPPLFAWRRLDAALRASA